MYKKEYNDFNSYLRKKFNTRVQKITVDAGLSCPNRDGLISYGGCIFCNSEGSGTNAFQKGKSITEQILLGKKAMVKRYKAKKFIVYFQSFSNTYAPFEKLKKLYSEALAVEDVIGISIGTRPDCITEKTLDLLESYTETHLVWLEYGLQSIHNKTLDFINRGHTFETFKKTVEKTKKRKNLNVCVHVILGLPDETEKDMLETAKVLSRMNIDGIKIHMLYAVKNTKLADLYLKKKYTPITQKQYAKLTANFLKILPSDIIVQRIAVDPHPKDFLSPLWAYRKSETLAMISNELKEKR